MEALLNSFGIVSKLVVGDMPITKRNEHLQMLAAREIDAVVSCDAISEGVDVPSVDACVLLRPTLSKVVYVQQVGRVLRKSPGKNYALIVDLVANVMRHGMPEAAFEIKKVEKRRSKQQSDTAGVKIEVCRSCFAAFTPNAEKMCPYCGQWQFKIEKRKVKPVKDEIVELVPEIVKPELWQPSWDEKGWKHSIRHLKDDVALMQFAKYKGYKPGWVYKIKQHRSKKYEKK
jgi:superfamily II DNA or RNA helicase